MGNARGPTRILKECSAVWHPTIRVHGCQQLSWIEYARNSLPVAASGMSPFECSVGYKPPLFPSQEPDAAVPSALAFVQRCRHTWERVREILLRSAGRTKAAADHRRSSPPTYVCGQQIWLSTKDLPSRKLAPRFIGPYRVAKVVNPVAIRLKLPPTLGRVHPVFHVSKVKPVVFFPPQPCRDVFLCFSAPPSVRPDTVGFHPDTCRSGLSADSLWMAQPLARICEQPRQLHCFCRCYGSSRRGDRTICVAEDSALLWLPVEALFTCLLFAVQINLRCTRIWILPLLPDIIQCCHMKIYNKYVKNVRGVLTSVRYCITVWFGSATKTDIRRLQRTVGTAERIIGAPLPSLQERYTSRVRKRAKKVTLDPSHPAHSLFELLPSGRCYRSLSTKTTRHKNSFFSPKPFPTWTTHNTPQYCTSVNNSSNLNLYIGHMHIHSSVYGHYSFLYIFIYYYCYS